LPALARLLYGKARWHELVEVEAAIAEQTTEPALRGYAYWRMSRVLVYRLGRMEEGIAALERAHTDLPNDIGIVEELCRLYELAADYGKWARGLEILFSLLQEPAARAGLAFRIARLYEENLSDIGRAIHWYIRELERDPTFAPAAEALAVLYERHEQWQPLVTMRLAEAEGLQDGALRAQAFSRVGELVEQRLRKPDDAIALYSRALAALPGYAPAFNALTRLLGAARRWPELIEVLEQLTVESYDADTRLTNLFKIGRLYEDALGDFTKAYHAYARVLEVRPQHAEALHAMQRTAERGGLYEPLVEALELEANASQESGRRLSLFHRAAEIKKIQLNQLDAAIASWKHVLELDARYEPALHALAGAYKSAGRWDEWIEVSRRILPLIQAGVSRASMQYELGRASEEKLGRVEPAMRWYREALGNDPRHELALLALDRLLDKSEKWSELVELLVASEGRLQNEPRRRAQICVRIGELNEHRLGKLDDARAAYERALEAVAGFRPAVEGRLRLLSVGRVDARLGDALGQEAESSTDVRHALRAAYQEAQVWRDQMKDPARAIRAFEFVTARDPSNVGALLALDVLYEEATDWEQLVRVLNVLSTVLTEPTSRITILRRLAEVLERHALGTPEQILAVWVKVLEIDPTNVNALEALELVALRTDNSTLLSQIDARLASLLEEPSLSAMYQTRFGETLEVSRDPSALDVLAGSLERDPEDIAAVRAMGRLATERGDVIRLELAADRECATTHDLDIAARHWLTAAEHRIAGGDLNGAVKDLETALERYPEHAAAASRLRDILLAQQDLERLVSTLTHAATRCKSAERALELRLMVAELLSDVKHDVPAAIAVLERAASVTQTQAPALLALGKLYTREGNHAKASERFERVLALTPTQDQALEARIALAAAYEQHLNRPAQAAAHLEAALQINPDDARTLRGLVEVRIRRREFDSAAEIASRWVRVESEPRRRAEGLALLGRVERARGNLQQAVTAYEQSVQLAGLEGSPAAELVELLGQQRRAGHTVNYQGYVNALSSYAEQRTAVGPGEVRVYQEIARVLDAELGQRERAIDILERVLASAPADVSLRSEVAAIQERAGNYAAAVESYRNVIQLDVTRADAYRGISRAFEQLERRSEATLALVPLVVLGAATEPEQYAVNARTARPVSLERTLELEEIVTLGMPSPLDPTGAVLTSIADALDRIDNPNLEQYGLVARDRIGSRSGHPLRTMADRVAAVLGADEFEFYVSSNVANACIEPGDPPCIIVPLALSQASEAVQAFALARVLAMLGRKWQAAERLDLANLESWVSAAVRLSEGGDEAQARRLAKALAWGRKGRVEEAAESYVRAGKPSVLDFVQRAKSGACRLAALLSDDLVGSIGWIRRTDSSQVFVHDLLRFWTQEAAFATRKRLGIT